MKKEYGINPNCSESVIRLFKVDYDAIPPDIKSNWWAMSEPTEGYSHMRPLPGTHCIYFYQMSVDPDLIKWLEEKKIPYDLEAPFQEQHPDWEQLEPSEQDEKETEKDGGGGLFYRRKPYVN